MNKGSKMHNRLLAGVIGRLKEQRWLLILVPPTDSEQCKISVAEREPLQTIFYAFTGGGGFSELRIT